MPAATREGAGAGVELRLRAAGLNFPEFSGEVLRMDPEEEEPLKRVP